MPTRRLSFPVEGGSVHRSDLAGSLRSVADAFGYDRSLSGSTVLEHQWYLLADFLGAVADLIAAGGIIETAHSLQNVINVGRDLKEEFRRSNFLKGVAKDMVFQMAEQLVTSTQEGRNRDLFHCVLECMKVHDREDAPELIRAIVEQIGGYVRKMVQQISQTEAVIKKAEFRHALRALQSNIPPRSMDQLHSLLSDALGMVDVQRVLGAGCMGEVLLCQHPQFGLVAVKLFNLEQLALFEDDLKFFKNLNNNMRLPLLLFKTFAGAEEYREVKTLVDKVQDMVSKPEVHRSMVQGFSASHEVHNMEIGRSVCAGFGIAVPRVFHHSTGVVVQEFIDGTLLEVAEPSRLKNFAVKLIPLIVNMLRHRRVHRDMHPGNLMVDPDAILDWGEVVVMQCGEAEALDFLYLVVQGSNASLACWRQLLISLNVTPKHNVDVSDTDYRFLLEGFSIPMMMQTAVSDSSSRQLIGAAKFEVPAWMDLLQSAFMAISISLRHCGLSSTQVQSRFLSQLPHRMCPPDVSLHQQ